MAVSDRDSIKINCSLTFSSSESKKATIALYSNELNNPPDNDHDCKTQVLKFEAVSYH